MTLSQSLFVLLQGWPRRGNTGVVDEDFNGTETSLGGVQCGLDAGCDSDVHHHALGLSVRSGDIIDGLGQGFRAARADGHARPARREKGRKKPSKTARSAGNQHMRSLDSK